MSAVAQYFRSVCPDVSHIAMSLHVENIMMKVSGSLFRWSSDQWCRISRQLSPPRVSTVGWTALLIVGVSGPYFYAHFENDPRVQRFTKAVITTLRKSDHRVRLPLIGVACWLALRITARAGLLVVAEAAVIGATAHYVLEQEKRRIEANRLDLHRLMQRPELCLAALGHDRPSWINFPNVQMVGWLSSMLASIWPFLCTATEDSVEKYLRVQLQKYKPTFLTKLELAHFSMGSVPLVIEGIQHHHITNTETVMDIHISWRSDKFDLSIVAGVSPLIEVQTSVTDVTFRIVCRVTLGPHLERFPLYGASHISLIGAPDVHFQLTTAKLSLDAIPGLSAWIHGFIDRLIAGFVFPKSIVTQIAANFDVHSESSAFDHRAAAQGKLRLTVHKALHVGSETCCVRVGLVGHASIATLPKSNNVKSDKGNCNFHDEPYHITVHDTSASVGVYLYRIDTFGREKLYGQHLFSIQEFVDDEKNNVKVHLTHPKGKHCTAEIEVSVKYSAFSSSALMSAATGVFSPREGDDREVSTPPRSLPSRNSFKKGHPIAPPSHRGFSRSNSVSHSSFAPVMRGTLFVKIDNCKGLKNCELVGTSDPYVVMSLDGKTLRTPVVDDCLDPVFNFEGEMEIEDVRQSRLEVHVFDENVTKDVLMAHTTIDLNHVLSSSGQLAKHTWTLTPQGTITMTLTMRLEG